jgi:hypothetical protein
MDMSLTTSYEQVHEQVLAPHLRVWVWIRRDHQMEGLARQASRRLILQMRASVEKEG